ncbi:MAG TPA: alpha/beta family hydrolase [Actinomycetales bacterium]|nr:alpha/beta family hydrolase [Actinomycetales bacterium]
MDTTTLDVDTHVGLARAVVDVPDEAATMAPVGRLLLGHGAGGGEAAKDLVRVRDVALGLGWAVARVVQPWRVAGKRVAAPPPKLDEAWLEVADALQQGQEAFAPGTPLVLGGRSAGARVACRTRQQLLADGVLCLAFPLHPPGRPEKTRLGELTAVAEHVPVLVVQGERDPFGSPTDVRDAVRENLPDRVHNVAVTAVAGDHSLSRDLDAVGSAAERFLTRWGGS